MFPTNRHSLQDFNLAEVRSGTAAVSGIWSVLITPSAKAAVDFADRYLDIFDEVARGDWHLAVGVEPSTGGRSRWQANQKFQDSIDELRVELGSRGEKVADFGIVFFDPHADALADGCVVIALDANEIANVALYRAGFEATHRAIRHAFKACGLDPYERIPRETTRQLLTTLDLQLSRSRVTSQFRSFGRAFANPLLGAAVSAPFG